MAWVHAQPPSGTRGWGACVVPGFGEYVFSFCDFQADRVVLVPAGLYYDFEQVSRYNVMAASTDLPSSQITARADEDGDPVTYEDYAGT